MTNAVVTAIETTRMKDRKHHSQTNQRHQSIRERQELAVQRRMSHSRLAENKATIEDLHVRMS